MGSVQPWHFFFIILVALIVFGAMRVARAAKLRTLPPPVARGSGADFPGWYPDPRDATRDRYFDGHTWTNETRPKT